MTLRGSSTRKLRGTSGGGRAFSLIEVVVATAIFAVSIVAVIGLLSPMTKRVEDVIDSEIAARLAASIQSELDRLAVNPGFDATAALVRPGAIVLFADPSGTRVRLSTAADNPLIAGNPPGLAERDRFFRITLSEQTLGGVVNPTIANMAAFPMRADVEWPYWIPVGPATVGATAANADPHDEVPATVRSRMSYFFALRR